MNVCSEVHKRVCVDELFCVCVRERGGGIIPVRAGLLTGAENDWGSSCPPQLSGCGLLQEVPRPRDDEEPLKLVPLDDREPLAPPLVDWDEDWDLGPLPAGEEIS